MNKKIKKIVVEIVKEILASGPSVDGSPSFRGGPYGIGHTRQIAGTDPSVEKMTDQEHGEINKNVDKQAWVNPRRKHGTQPLTPMQDIHGDPKLKRDMASTNPIEEEQLEERNSSDMQYTHLPGWPSMNALEASVQHIPNENQVVDSLRAGVSDGTEEYLVDDIIDELEREGKPAYYKEGAQGSANSTYQLKSELPPFYVSAPDSEDNDIGHIHKPGAKKSPIGGMGTVMFPKQFVPHEWSQESEIEDEDHDGISDSIDLDQPPELRMTVDEAKRKKKKSTRHPEKYGEKTPSLAVVSRKFKETKRSIVELIDVVSKAGGGFLTKSLMQMYYDMQKMELQMPADYMEEQAVDEEYQSKAQQRYFHAKAAEGDPKFKKLAREFDKETTKKQFAKLPNKAPKKESLNSDKIKNLVKEELVRQLIKDFDND